MVAPASTTGVFPPPTGFLIPSIPAVLGNFLVPMMIWAKDLAFPKLNLASWYVYIAGFGFGAWALLSGGVDTGWTMYTPYTSKFTYSNVVPVVVKSLAFSSIDVSPRTGE